MTLKCLIDYNAGKFKKHKKSEVEQNIILFKKNFLNLRLNKSNNI